MEASEAPAPAVTHVVLIELAADLAPATAAALERGARRLLQIPGVRFARVGRAGGDRQGPYTHLVVVELATKDDLAAYAPHPVHQSFLEDFIKPYVKDMLALDIFEPVFTAPHPATVLLPVTATPGTDANGTFDAVALRIVQRSEGVRAAQLARAAAEGAISHLMLQLDRPAAFEQESVQQALAQVQHDTGLEFQAGNATWLHGAIAERARDTVSLAVLAEPAEGVQGTEEQAQARQESARATLLEIPGVLDVTLGETFTTQRAKAFTFLMVVTCESHEAAAALQEHTLWSSWLKEQLSPAFKPSFYFVSTAAPRFSLA